MPVQKALAQVGVYRQTAKGAIGANPTFAHGVTGGTITNAEIVQEGGARTSAKRGTYQVFRNEVKASSEFTSLAQIKSIGLWLYGAMGACTTTGTVDPISHAFSTADTLPYLSIFSKTGGEIRGINNCKVDELTLKWDVNKPVEVSVKSAGCVLSYPATFVPTTDETGLGSVLTPLGGTFTLDLDGSTLAAASIKAGELTIKNNCEAYPISGTITGYDVAEGTQEHEAKFTIVPDDYTAFRNILTGAAAGTTAVDDAVMGSFSIVFAEAGTGTHTLTVASTACYFNCSLPDQDPKGGAAEIELAAIPVIPNGGTSPVSYTLTNAQASY